ncbi:SET_domain-containing protein [Hexamita inflata]|uniref:SET domain-containing protein n=1 Tax=Hexamita inflata TaxID=28002 RepID=A0AA86PC04_9EUKA|nr:SET domain-containing protein [Hexamita inflata]
MSVVTLNSSFDYISIENDKNSSLQSAKHLIYDADALSNSSASATPLKNVSGAMKVNEATPFEIYPEIKSQLQCDTQQYNKWCSSQIQTYFNLAQAHLQTILAYQESGVSQPNLSAAYEFFSISKSNSNILPNISSIIALSKSQYFIPTQSFTHPSIEVFQTKYMGRGFRTTQKIKTGEVIFVENAFVFGCVKTMQKMLSLKKQIYEEGKRVLQLQNLYSGQEFKGEMLCDEHIKIISDYNAYQESECRLGCSIDIFKKIFLNISLINHSCDSNVKIRCYGDVGVITAKRDIEAGEELLITYKVMTYPLKRHLDAFKDVWGFTCACPFCEEFNEAKCDTIDFAIHNMTKHLEQLANGRYLNEKRVLIIEEECLKKIYQYAHNDEQKKSYVPLIIGSVYPILITGCIQYYQQYHQNDTISIVVNLINRCLSVYGFDTQDVLSNQFDNIVFYSSLLTKTLVTKWKIMKTFKLVSEDELAQLLNSIVLVYEHYEAGGKVNFNFTFQEYMENDDYSMVQYDQSEV